VDVDRPIISCVVVHRFYCATLGVGLNNLAVEEAHHAAVTLRLQREDGVTLFDGCGHEGQGVVEQIDRRTVGVRVATIQTRPFDAVYRITLAVAMAKAHRQGYLIEKCTELGVAAIWPILAERSVARPGEAAVDKWSRRAIEAAKQSGRSWVPVIAKPRTLEEAVSLSGEFAAAAFTEPDEKGIPFRSFLSTCPADGRILVFVGPEGGWTDSEREFTRRRGVQSVRLAPAILRVETAAIAACAAVSMISIGGCASCSPGVRGASEKSC